MKTRLRNVIFAVLCGCQVQPGEHQATTQQEVTDCFGVANYCNATLPPVTQWAGQLPQSSPTTVIAIQQNPFVTGQWYAIAADWQAGQIPWILSFKTTDTPAVITATTNANRGWFGVRPPPPPPPPLGVDPRYVLESALRFGAIPQGAADAVGACKQ